MENLEWRPIPGYEGFFIISEYGDIKSLPREIIRSNGRNFFMKEGKLLKPFISNCGYKRIALRNNEKKIKYSVHRLVALAFLELDDSRPFVNHIDGDRSNNHFSNLEWSNMRENNCHRFLNKNKTSKYIGVSYIKAKKKFVATISFEGIGRTLGHFDNEEDAYAARCKFEKDNGIINKYL